MMTEFTFLGELLLQQYKKKVWWDSSLIRDSYCKMSLHLFVYEHIIVHLWFDGFRILVNYAPVMHCNPFCCYTYSHI